jgi:glucose/arabinose dehydrogenase
MFYTGDRFPQWKGQLFIAGLAGEQLGRVTLAGEKVLARETILPGVGRIRDIRQGPDGYIYLATEDRDGKPTPVVRLEPVDRGATR